MPHRKIIDADQCTWDVWEVVPTSVARAVDEERRREARPSAERRPRKIVVPESLRNGWLAFQCEGERRRISPIPPGWEAMTDAELVALLARATRVERARKPT
jgi:hypothetical protein